MDEWDFINKLINEESEKVDDFFFEDPIMEEADIVEKKKVGRPKESPAEKGKKALRKAKDHLSEAVKRLEIFSGKK